MDDTQRGLYGKYRVTRVNEDGTPKPGHENRSYFVLDVEHDPHASAALEAYAKSCAVNYPALSNDLHIWALHVRTRRLQGGLLDLRHEFYDPKRCLACGQEHGGSGNLPCPNMRAS